MSGRQPNWLKYLVRTCRSMHGCGICGRDITLGERYHDGGYGRRAHVSCLDIGCLGCGNPCDPHRKPRYCYECSPGHMVDV